jgi:radical SAM superfamily enzyme YgiQ (UPF0313 family)
MSKLILCIHPKNIITRDEYNYVLPIWGKKAFHMPLPLLTVAAMIPPQYEVKLIDLNIQGISDDELLNANMVFVTGMLTQKESIVSILKRCFELNVISVLGGPYATNYEGEIKYATCLVKKEAEDILSQLFMDYENGELKKVYQGGSVDLIKSPCPRFDLIEPNNYQCALVQYSRGCPYTCEFCDIPWLYGKTPRAKTISQFLNELETLYQTGFRGWVELADANFFTNKQIKELLSEIIEWQKAKNYPFVFRCEASINVVQKDEVLDLMVAANFRMVFVGVETPVMNSLQEANKFQNTRLNLLESIDKIQKKGIQVDIGSIVGFDNDPIDIFEIQKDFVSKSKVIISCLGLLGVLNHTPLYERMAKENRLLFQSNVNRIELNFEPKMDRKILLKGFINVFQGLYDPKNYFNRCEAFLKAYNAGYVKPSYWYGTNMFIRACLDMMPDKYVYHYIIFVTKILFTNPKKLLRAIDLGVWGYHLYKIAEDVAKRTIFDNPEMNEL